MNVRNPLTVGIIMTDTIANKSHEINLVEIKYLTQSFLEFCENERQIK